MPNSPLKSLGRPFIFCDCLFSSNNTLWISYLFGTILFLSMILSFSRIIYISLIYIYNIKKYVIVINCLSLEFGGVNLTSSKIISFNRCSILFYKYLYPFLLFPKSLCFSNIYSFIRIGYLFYWLNIYLFVTKIDYQ